MGRQGIEAELQRSSIGVQSSSSESGANLLQVVETLCPPALLPFACSSRGHAAKRPSTAARTADREGNILGRAAGSGAATRAGLT